ncbi:TRIGALACTOSYLDIACYLGLYCEROL chloroplastic isoform B [Chlorella sorokiniana]|uniref:TRIGALACTOSYLDIACYLGLYCEROL chloroplastic isoform B n=1 Tax=Chlorella sorokiniana TaxID=3076 RepID=A0A2P6TG52_CHLSO|nr:TRIGALACTOSYLDIACYLGLYCEROL chloroplastic isoform B [Chlorella sorokiniana]|eukprot:PRW33090.1 TRIGALACTOSYLDIACYLGLYCEROL chloroplastic isoform B [Chlorella sorokiniana]
MRTAALQRPAEALAGRCRPPPAAALVAPPAPLPRRPRQPSSTLPQQLCRSAHRRQRLVAASAADPVQTAQQTAAAPAASSGSPEPEADVLIEFKDVWKSFGSKQILRGASFKIRRGEAVGIIGSSGTGKSTTLRLAAGLLQPDKGVVLIKGEPRRGLISDDDTSDKLKVGLVFQSGALFDSLTVGENVGFLLHEHTSLPQSKIQELVAESLGKVGLSGVEPLYPSELSGGMKKRVALARAIVRDEKHDNVEQVIMYDEPTAGLDPVASTVVEDLIRDLHEKHGEGHHHEPDGGSSTSSASSYAGSTSFDSLASANGGSPASANGRSRSSTAGAAPSGNGTSVTPLGALPAHKQPPPGGITSYIVVTHQHSTIRRAVDRIIFLHEGRVVWQGTVEEFDTTDEPIVRQFASGSLEGPIRYE